MLRLYPPAAFTGRRLCEPLTVCGHQFSKGTFVGVALCTIARDPELYPDPDRIDPSRWLNRKEAPTPIELSQFGGGPHFCIGYHLAWLEMIQFAVSLARRMSRDGLRPRLADGPAPRYYGLPLGHPSRETRIEFV
jgi:cytochrome P450 monooxygenase